MAIYNWVHRSRTQPHLPSTIPIRIEAKTKPVVDCSLEIKRNNKHINQNPNSKQRKVFSMNCSGKTVPSSTCIKFKRKLAMKAILLILQPHFPHVPHRQVTCISRCVSAGHSGSPDRSVHHQRCLEELLLWFFGLPEPSPPRRAHLVLGTTGDLEHLTQDMTCLGGNGG